MPVGDEAYAYEDITASTLLRRIVGDWGMQTGVIEESGYVLPSRIENQIADTPQWRSHFPGDPWARSSQ